MKKLLLFVCGIVCVACSKAPPKYSDYSAVWSTNPDPWCYTMGTFSWGKNPFPIGSLHIDLDAPPRVSVQGGTLTALVIERFEDSLYVNGTFADGKPSNGGIIIHKIDDNTIWIEDYTGHTWFLDSGIKNKYIYPLVHIAAQRACCLQCKDL